MNQSRFTDDRVTFGGTIEERALQWFLWGQVGLSSQAIAEHMLFGTRTNTSDPRDVHDFQSCMVLLDIIPEWRPRMAEMAGVAPWWAPFAEHWDELEMLCRTDGQACDARIRELMEPLW